MLDGKYILLDFDGVLTSDAFTRQYVFEHRRENLFGVDWFAPSCIDALRHIVEETGARIVISSSWRDLGEYRIRKLWDYNRMPGRLDETTPTTPEYILMKSDAMRHWISTHEGDRFAVLDDDDLDVPNLVRTKPQEGLTREDAEMAIKILNEYE